jgi:hypothetical protein
MVALPALGQAVSPGPGPAWSWLQQRTQQAGGKYTAYVDGGYDAIDDMDLAQLVQESEVILVGRTGRGLPSRLSADGRSLVTEHKVTASTVLKGAVLPTNTLTVVRPGGRMVFADGGVAEVLLRGPYVMLSGDQSYVMFLKRREAGLGFEPAGGPQGLYQVEPSGRIKSLDRRPEARIAARYKDSDLKPFLDDITRQLRASAALAAPDSRSSDRRQEP